MARFALGKNINLEVTARLIARGTDRPVTGSRYQVKLFDKDFFEDDYLGQSSPDHEGRVRFLFNPGSLDKNEPLKENSLDFYFLVYKDGKEIFRSKVMEDVQIEEVEEFKMGEGEVIDIGTFLIDA